MTKFFLSSHGHLASGLASSLDILLGGHDRVTVFDAYVDEKSLNDALDAFFQTVGEKDQVILLSDMYGGSVNSTMYTYLDRPNTTLVAGVISSGDRTDHLRRRYYPRNSGICH